MKTKLSFLVLIVFLISCSTNNQDETIVNERPVSEHALTMATIYSYYAHEYRDLTYQAFNIARNEQLESFKEELGRKFIILPNAMYGNWPGSIGVKDAKSMDSLLHEMTRVFE